MRASELTGRAGKQVILGDGALWIWNLADMLAPEAIQIVDVFHAKDRLSKLAARLREAKRSADIFDHPEYVNHVVFRVVRSPKASSR